jgi:hypothetical protein
MFVFLLAGKSVSLSESERKYKITWLQSHRSKANFGALQNRTLSITDTNRKGLIQSKTHQKVRCLVNLRHLQHNFSQAT